MAVLVTSIAIYYNSQVKIGWEANWGGHSWAVRVLLTSKSQRKVCLGKEWSWKPLVLQGNFYHDDYCSLVLPEGISPTSWLGLEPPCVFIHKEGTRKSHMVEYLIRIPSWNWHLGQYTVYCTPFSVKPKYNMVISCFFSIIMFSIMPLLMTLI